MAELIWETIKVRYCKNVQAEVGLEAEVIYPADILPDQPRVLAHRCSHGYICTCDGRVSCIWAGSNPCYDPFAAE